MKWTVCITWATVLLALAGQTPARASDPIGAYAGKELAGIALLVSAFPAANISTSSTAEIAKKVGGNGEDGGERPSGGDDRDARLGNRCCPS
jgi:hypothetical protein